MDKEYVALIRRGTWEIIPRLCGVSVVSYRWVYTPKYLSDGTIHHYKACMVAHGFSQQYDINYQETFSPMVHLRSIYIIVSIAVTLDWLLHQLDVSNAFLYGDLDEEVYMEQSPGYMIEAKSSKMYCLRKAIYGLKQSPRP